MSGELKNQRVVILATDGFAQSELEPLKILRRNSTDVDIISLHSCETKGVQYKEKSDKVHIGIALGRAKARQRYHPCSAGRSPRPDVLRTDPRAVRFVRQFVDAKQPIAAICHAPWTLIGADAVRGRRMTSWPSLKTDLRNAVPNGLTRKSWLTRGWRLGGSPMTCRPSARRY